MNHTQSGLRAALYARVSGEEQKQGHNIDSQIAELREFAKQRDWSVVEAYQDEAWSGATLARPALNKLRDDAGKKLFDIVLINDVDRLARNVAYLGYIKRELERSGVKVIFRKVPLNDNATDNLLLNMLGSFAEFERELIMDRTRRGRMHKVETRQEFIGCIPPYGYRYVPGEKPDRAGKLMINVEEAAVAREMYRWVDSLGISAQGVVRRLGTEGIRPRKGGIGWSKSSVMRILRGTIYSGTWNYNKLQGCYPKSLTPEAEARARKSSTRLRPREEWIPVALPDSLRLISPDQWTRVQQQLDRNRCFSPRNSRHQYLLSGLVRCGGCGSRYVGNPSHGRFEYRCIKRCKRMPLVGEHILDSNVWSALESALNDPALFTKAISEIKRPDVPRDNQAGQIDAALTGLRGEEARVLEAYRLAILTPEQLAQELEMIASRRRMLEKENRELAQRLQPALPVQSSVEEYCHKIRERLGNLTFETKRSVIRLLLRKVVFEGDQVRITGIIPLSDQGGIADTMVHSRAHNPASGGGIADTMVDHYAHNPSVRARAFAEFLLVRNIERSSRASFGENVGH